MRPVWIFVGLSQFWLGLSYITDKNQTLMLVFAAAWVAVATVALLTDKS